MEKRTFNFLFDRLLSEEYFSDYKIGRSNSSLVLKMRDSKLFVILEHWYEHGIYNVNPMYGKRFELLHRWKEKICFRKLSDQRNDSTVIFVEPELKTEGNFGYYSFDFQQPTFEDDYQHFKNTLINSMEELIVKRFPTLTEVYDYLVRPALNGETEFPCTGGDWIMTWAALTKIVAPAEYEKVTQLIKKRAYDLVFAPNRIPEINVSYYYPRLDEIFAYLDHIDFSNPSHLPPVPNSIVYNGKGIFEDEFVKQTAKRVIEISKRRKEMRQGANTTETATR